MALNEKQNTIVIYHFYYALKVKKLILIYNIGKYFDKC